MRKLALPVLTIGVLAASLASAASMSSSLKAGKAEIQSAGPLAFGPEGVLFVADAKQATVFALDTGDSKAGQPSADVPGINEKLAAVLGIAADQLIINDMAINPVSKKTYFSVSRGKGADAVPAILRVDSKGKIEEVALDSIKHSKVSLPNAPADVKNSRGQSPRQEAITDLAFIDGKVIIAGLSNEEFASNLRVIPFPFANADGGTSVEIFHGAHGRYETNAPIRTFVTYQINNQPHVLAAYTCTPLVKFPLSDLKPGKKVMGSTIAELGNRNRPLDMIVYTKNGTDYILLNNSSRGVMKLSAKGLDKYSSITKQTEPAGVPYETIASMKGVDHIDKIDNNHGMMLVRADNGSLSLKQFELP